MSGKTLEVSVVVQLPEWAKKLDEELGTESTEGVFSNGRSVFEGESPSPMSIEQRHAFLLAFLDLSVSEPSH